MASSTGRPLVLVVTGTSGAGKGTLEKILLERMPELKLAGIDLGTRASFRGLDGDVPSPILGFVVLATVIVLGLLVANLRRSGLGQRMLAVRSTRHRSPSS